MEKYETGEPLYWFSEHSGQWVYGRFFDHIPANDRMFNNEEPLCLIKYSRNLEVVLSYDKLKKKGVK